MSGASLAYRLARLGRDVLVIDDARPGRATGWNPGGINPLHGPGFPGVMERFYRDAFGLHESQRQDVGAASGIDFGWRVVDRLFLARDDAEADDLRRYVDFYNALDGFSGRWMDAAEIAQWDSRVDPSWVGGLMTRGNVRVDAERYRLALLASAEMMGAKVIPAGLRSIETRLGRIVAIDWGEGRVKVCGLCMAAGSWAGRDVAGWEPGDVVEVTPLIGDLLLVKSDDRPPAADVSHGLTAIYQHDRGDFWIGGTSRREGPLGESSDAIEQELLTGARSLMPGWGPPQVIARSSAARPSTCDGLPVVGRSPSYENGWIINGLGGKGILLSAWAAQSLIQMMDAGGDLPEFAPVSPSRATG
jgi:glycine/D-amino acid oxidase-like deaminating enzyme